MEITMTELALFAWAMLATSQWLQLRDEFKHHRMMDDVVFKGIARGKIKVVEHDDSFEFEEV